MLNVLSFNSTALPMRMADVPPRTVKERYALSATKNFQVSKSTPRSANLCAFHKKKKNGSADIRMTIAVTVGDPDDNKRGKRRDR